ncbi:MAG TPA: peptidoglycan DD-metalloendopeptidase family protein [Caulobacteraceae bacterium]|jgi:murein DD-endopeptidase MepM/ murein hydrolase activator NlpD
MKRFLLIGLSTAALAGCATPQYPVSQGYVAPPPIKPQYPARQAAPAPTPAAAPDSAPSATRDSAAQTEAQPTGAPAPAAVESSPLEPVATQPQPLPQAQPPAQTTPAAQSPPAAQPATQSPPAVQPATQSAPAAAQPVPPPEAYEAPAPRSVVRYVTDGKVVAARGMYRDYEVQKGDHLDAIARDLNTSRRELIDANRLRKPYGLRPGEHLKVPVAEAYVVAPGDTLGAVAKRFGVGLGELSALNDLPQRGRLTAGMYVALPAHYDDHGPSRITVTEQAYAAPRPRAVYRAAPTPAYSPPTTGGPYVASPEAVAAGAARRAEPTQPSSSPNFAYARPSTVPSEASRPPEAPVNATALASLGQGKFIWPVKGDILSKFGASGVGRRNDGVDIAAPTGTEVRATAVGEVVYAGDQVPGFGNLVLIKHAGGWVSAYAHLANVDVHMRENVYQGQQIGAVGVTGGVTQPQLHFEIRYAATTADKAKPIDPLLVLPQ